ncbi:abortive infection family protein [Burkholderia cepacia]|uniref:abortive infection family protein n=1 Tax=Burkholderia cepacia TaxID=292 RepID=UPI0021576E1D|nr:abortive infection family protein [Burkholderia cepacia]
MFTIKFLRTHCEHRGVEVNRDKPLHSLLGEYVKAVRAAGLLESEMTDRILRSSSSIFEAFNDVRNKKSLAHDNPILNHSEALLIFSHVGVPLILVRFISVWPSSCDKALRFAPNIKCFLINILMIALGTGGAGSLNKVPLF